MYSRVYFSLCWFWVISDRSQTQNIVAAFQGMHVSPAKHSFAWLSKMWLSDRQTHTLTHTDRRQTKWSLCAAMLRRRHNKIEPTWKIPYIRYNSITRYNNKSMLHHTLFCPLCFRDQWVWSPPCWCHVGQSTLSAAVSASTCDHGPLWPLYVRECSRPCLPASSHFSENYNSLFNKSFKVFITVLSYKYNK